MGNSTFNLNDPAIFVVVGLIILFVVAESVFFLIKAWRRGIAIGMEKHTLHKIVRSSAIFTIAPAVAILLGVVTLSKKLGVALPWLRLSIVGAITYELTAAEAAAVAVGTSISDSATALSGEQFAAIAWVMSLGIIVGLFLIPIFCKKILHGISALHKKDDHWGDLFSNALFMGMISAFLGVIFATVTKGIVGWVPVFVMLVSALLMLLLGLAMKKLHWKWLEDYALPITMIGGMALAIPITNFANMLAK